MDDALPYRLKLAAAASLMASFILAATPFVVSKPTILAVAFANWCLFIVTVYFAAFPLLKWGVRPSPAEMARVKVLSLVLLSFTIASWTAFALAN